MILVSIFGGVLLPAFSSSPALQTDCPELNWREIRAGSFNVLFTASHVTLANEIADLYVPTITDELGKYEQAFGWSLTLPISIRIYPGTEEFFCLNPIAPRITPEDTHSHIGTREIALMADVINRSPMTWESQAMNALRHELAVLFTEQLAEGQAPPGLMQGLGGYFEKPAETFSTRFQQASQISQPDRSWQRLWEEDAPPSDSAALLQQTSITAFLIDVHGWAAFLEFLRQIPEQQGYRQASVAVYGVNVSELSEHWQRYFPVYIERRWQANVIHSYDLSPYHFLIENGAYEDAYEGLTEAQQLLSLFGDDAQLRQAEELLLTAEQGTEAGQLAAEARQAIVSGDFQSAQGKATEALRLYQTLGDDRRTEEVSLYLQIATEVVGLRSEIDRLSGGAVALDPIRTERLVQIGKRLSQLGDRDGTRQVQLALLLLGAGRQRVIEGLAAVGVVISALLVYRRIRTARLGSGPYGDLL